MFEKPHNTTGSACARQYGVRAQLHHRHSRRNPQGGRISVEQPIHISNVLPVNPKTSHGTRVRYQTAEDGGKKRVATDGTEIGTVKRAK